MIESDLDSQYYSFTYLYTTRDTQQFKKELDSIEQASINSITRPKIIKYLATISNFSNILFNRTRCLHIACHASNDDNSNNENLLFESEIDSSSSSSSPQDHLIDILQIQQLLIKSPHRLELVVLTACHSNRIAQTFIDAGVPHVIANNSLITESSITQFTYNFYNSLFNQHSIFIAYNCGRSSASQVQSTDIEPFILLPTNGPKHVATIIYEQLKPRILSNSTQPLSNEEEKNSLWKGTITPANSADSTAGFHPLRSTLPSSDTLPLYSTVPLASFSSTAHSFADVSFAVSHSSSSPSTAHTPYDIAYLYFSPVYCASPVIRTPLNHLQIDFEISKLIDNLPPNKTTLALISHATKKTINRYLAPGSEILHFSGHGLKKSTGHYKLFKEHCLDDSALQIFKNKENVVQDKCNSLTIVVKAIENQFAKALTSVENTLKDMRKHWTYTQVDDYFLMLENSDYPFYADPINMISLRQYILSSIGKNNKPPRLVFLSSCYSEGLITAFQSIGVESILAIDCTQAVFDDDSRNFMGTFYYHLFRGASIESAYIIAKGTVPVKNQFMFKLFPPPVNPDMSKITASFKPSHGVIFPSLPDGTALIDRPHEVKTNISCQVEDFFMSQSQSVCTILEKLVKFSSTDLVTIYGRTGIGKTKLIKSIIQFVSKRSKSSGDKFLFKGILMVDLKELNDNNGYSILNLCNNALISANLPHVNEINELKKSGYLFVFDSVEYVIQSPYHRSSDRAIQSFLADLLNQTNCSCILVSIDNLSSLGEMGSLKEASYEMPSISFHDSIKLWKRELSDTSNKLELSEKLNGKLKGNINRIISLTQKLKNENKNMTEEKCLEYIDHLINNEDINERKLRKKYSEWELPPKQLFIGRVGSLNDLQSKLDSKRGVVIMGTGGLGKSSITIHYAYTSQQKKKYKYIAWFPGEKEKLISAVERFAMKCDPKASDNRTLIGGKIEIVLEWFQSHTDWLIIIDNAEKYEDVSFYLPIISTVAQKNGYFILTSRYQDWSQHIEPLVLPELNENESIDLLKHLSGITNDDDNMRKLAHQMGHLALALTHAAAYIKQKRISVKTYYDSFCGTHPNVLDNKFQTAVETTWIPSIKAITDDLIIDQIPPIARILLFLCAYLDPDEIPLSLIATWFTTTYPDLKNPDDSIKATLRSLRLYSLIFYEEDQSSIKMHRVLQATLRKAHQIMKVLPSTDDESFYCQPLTLDWYKKLLKTVSKEFKSVFTKYGINERQQKELLPHLESLYGHFESVAKFCQGRNVNRFELSEVWSNLGFIYTAEQKFALAEGLLKKALIVAETTDESSKHKPNIIKSLARVYYAADNIIEALKWDERAYELDPKNIECVHSLADAYHTVAVTHYSTQEKKEEFRSHLRKAQETFAVAVALGTIEKPIPPHISTEYAHLLILNRIRFPNEQVNNPELIESLLEEAIKQPIDKFEPLLYMKIYKDTTIDIIKEMLIDKDSVLVSSHLLAFYLLVKYYTMINNQKRLSSVERFENVKTDWKGEGKGFNSNNKEFLDKCWAEMSNEGH